MACTEDVGILLRGVRNLVERWHAAVAGELENMRRELDNADIDVASFERIHTCPSIN